MLCLGRHAKEAGDEGDLPGDISFAYPSDLSLANHVHHLVPLERSPGRFQRKEAHPWFDQPFDEPMVLLDEVVEILDQDGSFTLSGKTPLALRSAIALG